MQVSASTLKSFCRSLATLTALLLLTGCNLSQSPDNAGVIGGAPTVRLVSPLPNALYLENVAVNISAQIGNAGADIDRVEVALDDSIIATLPQPNTTSAPAFNIVHTWTASGEGTHTLSVTAFRADGSSSDAAAVTISVRTQAAGNLTDSVIPTAGNTTVNATATTGSTSANTRAATSTRVPPTPRPTNTSASQAAPAAAPTSNVPTASFTQGINVRRGPGTNFEPPIGVFAAGQTSEILSLNLDGTWYKVRYGGGEGWVYAPFTTASGNTANLPREAGPPPPPPPTATTVLVIPTVATAAPQTNVNLVVGIVVLDPSEPRCGETFSVGLDVANLGSVASTLSGTVSLRDVRASDGSTQGETVGGYPILQANETFRVNMPITISTWYEEDHRLIMTVDPQNQIPETESGDNVREVTYRLLKGNCP